MFSGICRSFEDKEPQSEVKFQNVEEQSKKGYEAEQSQDETYREDETPPGVGRMSMMRLLQDASLPLEMYLKHHGLASLVNPQCASMPAVGFEINASEQRVDEQSCTPSNVQNQEEIQEE